MSDDAGKLRLVDPSTRYSFDFGTATGIGDTFQKSVSVTPIVTKPKQDAFPVESRTYKQVTVSFTRRNPLSTSSSGSDSAKWSNALWERRLMESLDRWQARTDGYQLYYIPSDDNPYVPPIRGEDGGSYETGYVKNVNLAHEKGHPEVIKGSFEFHFGSMRVRNRASSAGGYSRDRFSITLSDENGSNSIFLLKLGGDTEINLITSCSITGGPEAPFEYARITIPRKALSAAYPSLTGSDALGNRVRAGRNKLIISLAGTSSMTLTKVKLSKDTLTLTAYCDAERIRGYTLDSRMENTAASWIDEILKTNRYGVGFSDSEIVRSYTVPTPDTEYDAKEDMKLSFDKGTNAWYVLQVAAMCLGARVFFADNKAYVVDYRMTSSDISAGEVDLYSGTDYAGSVIGDVDLGDEGTDTVVNTLRIRCMKPVVKDKRYSLTDGTLDTASFEYEVSDSESKGIYGTKDGGLLSLPTLMQNADDEEVVFQGSPATEDSEGTETPDEGESGSEGTEGGNTGESTQEGETEFYRQAYRFGSNYLDYLSEAQQTVEFTMRELAGSGSGSWVPYFGPASAASKITDDVNEIYVDNLSEEGRVPRPQKLALKTFTREYPDCKTEYSWGVLASIDLSSSTSKIVSAQNIQ